MSWKLERFVYQAFIPAENRGGTYDVILSQEATMPSGKVVTDYEGPMTPPAAEKLGVTLAEISANINASALAEMTAANAAKAQADTDRDAALAAQQQAEADRDAAIAAGTTLLAQLQQAQTEATASATQATDLQSQLKTAGDQMIAAAAAIAQLQSQLADAVAQIAQLQAPPVEDAPPPPPSA